MILNIANMYFKKLHNIDFSLIIIHIRSCQITKYLRVNELETGINECNFLMVLILTHVF